MLMPERGGYLPPFPMALGGEVFGGWEPGMGIKESDASAPKQGLLSLDSGVKKNGRKIQQPVDSQLASGEFEVAKAKRWIAEHSEPVVLSAERREEISRALKATRSKVLGVK